MEYTIKYTGEIDRQNEHEDNWDMCLDNFEVYLADERYADKTTAEMVLVIDCDLLMDVADIHSIVNIRNPRVLFNYFNIDIDIVETTETKLTDEQFEKIIRYIGQSILRNVQEHLDRLGEERSCG